MKRTGRKRAYTLKMPDGSPGFGLRFAISRQTAEKWDAVHGALEQQHGRLTHAETLDLLLTDFLTFQSQRA